MFFGAIALSSQVSNCCAGDFPVGFQICTPTHPPFLPQYIHHDSTTIAISRFLVSLLGGTTRATYIIPRSNVQAGTSSVAQREWHMGDDRGGSAVADVNGTAAESVEPRRQLRSQAPVT